MRRRKILIVDDEIYIVHILEVSLTMEGYDVVAATDGKEALDRLETEEPDLVVLDIMMPKMDGYEVCRRIRADRHHSHTPIILLSAKGRPVDREVGFEAGADDYVIKPFSPRQLIEKIRDLLEQQSLDEVARVG